jgi:Na+/phosphate symporter
MRSKWLLSLLVLGAFAAAPMHAAEEKKPEAKKEEKKEEKAERLWPRGPEIAKLKTEAGLADIDIHNIKAAVSEVDKKNEQVSSPESVKAAEEKVKKAKEALKAAEEELDTAKGGFDLLDERKKAAYNAIPADKREKAQDILKYKPKVEKTEKKAEAEKK